MSATTPALLAQLTKYRTTNVHSPLEVSRVGETLVERGWFTSGGDDVWTVLEQVALAALECGKTELADVCATRLSTRFPDSPRVAVILGSMMEGKGMRVEAKVFYEKALESDEGNLNIRKRLISLYLSSPSTSTLLIKTPSEFVSDSPPASTDVEEGIRMLVDFLDTYYNDVEGWLELAVVYAQLGLYEQSLSALSHTLLLAPHNPFHLLLHAETAYTLGQYELAYKEMLRVIEMSDGVGAVGGVGRRAAMGVKLCIARIEASRSSASDHLLKPQDIKKVDLMVTKLILETYGKESAGGEVVRKWVGGY